jgi:hypothetical protein
MAALLVMMLTPFECSSRRTPTRLDRFGLIGRVCVFICQYGRIDSHGIAYRR